jgi:flagellar hook-associated protein 1 FlgK
VGATARVLEPVRVLLTDDDSAVAAEVPNEVDDAFFANFRFESGALGHAAVARSAHGTRIGVPGGTRAEGNGVYLQALSDAMAAAREPIGFVSQNARAGGALMASEIASFLAGMAARSDDDRAYLTARQSTLAEQESHLTGVDSDAELESLMLVEQTYAANARVLSVIDELMKLLLEV